jgi:hypothetical protein
LSLRLRRLAIARFYSIIQDYPSLVSRGFVRAAAGSSAEAGCPAAPRFEDVLLNTSTGAGFASGTR